VGETQLQAAKEREPGFLFVRCVHAHEETRRIAANIAKLPELLPQRSETDAIASLPGLAYKQSN
jgi:hypothetical protein